MSPVPIPEPENIPLSRGRDFDDESITSFIDADQREKECRQEVKRNLLRLHQSSWSGQLKSSRMKQEIDGNGGSSLERWSSTLRISPDLYALHKAPFATVCNKRKYTRECLMRRSPAKMIAKCFGGTFPGTFWQSVRKVSQFGALDEVKKALTLSFRSTMGSFRERF